MRSHVRYLGLIGTGGEQSRHCRMRSATESSFGSDAARNGAPEHPGARRATFDWPGDDHDRPWMSIRYVEKGASKGSVAHSIGAGLVRNPVRQPGNPTCFALIPGAVRQDDLSPGYPFGMLGDTMANWARCSNGRSRTGCEEVVASVPWLPGRCLHKLPLVCAGQL